jgi:hypothetical protein
MGHRREHALARAFGAASAQASEVTARRDMKRAARDALAGIETGLGRSEPGLGVAFPGLAFRCRRCAERRNGVGALSLGRRGEGFRRAIHVDVRRLIRARHIAIRFVAHEERFVDSPGLRPPSEGGQGGARWAEPGEDENREAQWTRSGYVPLLRLKLIVYALLAWTACRAAEHR